MCERESVCVCLLMNTEEELIYRNVCVCVRESVCVSPNEH